MMGSTSPTILVGGLQELFEQLPVFRKIAKFQLKDFLNNPQRPRRLS